MSQKQNSCVNPKSKGDECFKCAVTVELYPKEIPIIQKESIILDLSPNIWWERD